MVLKTGVTMVLQQNSIKKQLNVTFNRNILSYETFLHWHQNLQYLKSSEAIKWALYDKIYLSTAIGLTPGGSSTVHIYTQTIHRPTQIQTIHRTTQIITNLEECRPCPIFARFTPTFALQLRKKYGKISVRVDEELQYTYYTLPKHPHITKLHTHTHTHTHTHAHTLQNNIKPPQYK